VSKDYDNNDLFDESTFDKKKTPTTFDFNTYGRASLDERIQYPELNQ
jgi:hypothetical protein